jgi:hypothetical protein
VAVHSSGQTVFRLTHVERITLSAGEEIDEVAGGANAMSVDRIGEVGDWASEGQTAGVYEAGFIAGYLARKGARGKTRGTFLSTWSLFVDVVRWTCCSILV